MIYLLFKINMACKALNCFFRFLFALSLVIVAIKGCNEINDNKGFVSQNMRLLGEKLSLGLLIKYRVYSGLVIIIENYLFVLTAFFLLFSVNIAKLTGILAVLIELILVHNPIFYGENVYRGVASQYLAVLGGILLF